MGAIVTSSKQLRVLVLIHHELIPPQKATIALSKNADWKAEFDVIRTLSKLGHEIKVLGVYDDLRIIRKAVEEWKPHIAFNLLEEFAGEAIFDQHVISFLELIGLPYTGCGPRGLMLTRDKAIAKKILTYHRVPVPKFSVFQKNKRILRPKILKFPLIVKSLTEEASLGISQASVVYDEKSFIERVNFVHDHLETDAIAERFIEGKELYVGILGNERTKIFPVWEMIFKDATSQMEHIATQKVKFNPEYRKKYGITTRHATGMSDLQREKIKSLCKRVYRALGINGYARIDLRLTPDGNVFFIEANPNPNIEEDEDFSNAAEKAGYKYTQLLQKILRLGVNWTPANFR